MSALFKYYLTDYLRSYRYFPPLAALLVVISIHYSAPKPIPVLGSYAFTVGLVFIVCGWLSLTFFNTEDPVQTQVVQTQAGSLRKVFVGRLLVSFFISGSIALFAVVFPIVTFRFSEPVTVSKLSLGIVGHLISAFLGGIAGAFFYDALVPKLSYSWGGLTLIWAASIASKGVGGMLPSAVRWLPGLLPPVSSVIQTLIDIDGGKIIAPYTLAIRFIYAAVYISALILLFCTLVLRTKGRSREKSRQGYALP